MTVADVADAFYRRQQIVAGLSARQALAAWARLDENDLDGSWRELRRDVVAALLAGQLAAATAGQAYVEQLVREQGEGPDPAGVIETRALVGVGADGVPLDALAQLALIAAKQRISGGAAPSDALASGASRLRLYAVTESQDAGRNAVTVAQTVERKVTGYVRYVNPPTCARCAILAGREYRWSDGFDRHPGCDCVHVAVIGRGNAAQELAQDPMQLVRDGQVRGLSKADQQAIDEGADLGRVVNAKLGMAAPGSTLRRRGRQTPTQILARAGNDRTEAVRLLRRHGYIR